MSEGEIIYHENKPDCQCRYCNSSQLATAQARIQELEGLVREMESDIRFELANILAVKRHLMELGEGNYIQEILSMSCSHINEILNREIVKSIMEKVKCPQ